MWRDFRPLPLPENSDILDQSPLAHGLSTASLPLAASESLLSNYVCYQLFFCLFFGQVCGRRPVAAITGRPIAGTTVTDTTTATPLMCKSLL